LLHTDDLGGQEVLSEAQRSILRRVVSLEVELERLEGILAGGGAIDLDLYSRCANTCRRLLESLGVQRKPKDVTPSLAEIIRQHADAEDSNPKATPSLKQASPGRDSTNSPEDSAPGPAPRQSM
jgi:hypothetical protein